MNGRLFPIGSSQNPVVQVLSFLLGAVFLIGALLMGTVILAFILGAGLLVGAVIWVRLWWAGRRFASARGGFGTEKDPHADARPKRDASARVIEVEYTVLDDDNDGTKP